MTRRRSCYRNMEERLFFMTVEWRGHWLWLGHLTRDGYPRMNVWHEGKTRQRQAHRVSYETFIGPIPPGHDLNHSRECPRSCIHPNHLTPFPYRFHRALTGFKANPPP